MASSSVRTVSSAASQDIMRSRGWELMLSTFNEDDAPAEQGTDVDTNTFRADLQKAGSKALELYQAITRLVSSLQVLKRAVTITAAGGPVWGEVIHLISHYGPALVRMVYNGITTLKSEEEQTQKRRARNGNTPKPQEFSQAEDLLKQIWTMVEVTENATMPVYQILRSNVFAKRKRSHAATEGLVLLRDVIHAKLVAIGKMTALYQVSPAAQLTRPAPKPDSRTRGSAAHRTGQISDIGEVSIALRVLKVRLAEVGSNAMVGVNLRTTTTTVALNSCPTQQQCNRRNDPGRRNAYRPFRRNLASKDPSVREERRKLRDVANAELQRTQPQGQKLEVTVTSPWEVCCVSVSPNGAFLATGTKSSTIAVWSMATGQLLHEMEANGEWVVAISWCPESTMFVAATLDRTAIVWNAATGQPLYELHGNEDSEVQDFVEDVSWSPDGALIATASWDTTAGIWNASTGAWELCLQGHTDEVCAVQFSPDSSKVATGSKDRTCAIWNPQSGQRLVNLEGHSAKVSGIAWSPDGGRIATASWDSTAVAWNVATGDKHCVFRGHSRLLTSIAWSPDNQTLATSSYDKTVVLWDMKGTTGSDQPVLARVLGEHAGPVNAVCWSIDGRHLVSASDDGYARITRVCARCTERSAKACPQYLK